MCIDPHTERDQERERGLCDADMTISRACHGVLFKLTVIRIQMPNITTMTKKSQITTTITTIHVIKMCITELELT